MPIHATTLPSGQPGFQWGKRGKKYRSRAEAARQAAAAHANGWTGDARAPSEPLFAMDRSVRSYDSDGHLRVATSPISKTQVSPYWGREIPEYESLGLEPDRVYKLWRHPEELKRAAHTFEGKPVLLIHRGATADDHPRSLTVGAVGQPVTWDGTHLHAPLSIWDKEAIDGIEDRTKRQLSCGYRYRADMTPGTTPDGDRHDGVMRDIEGNHVALVPEGRAGSDVAVGDAAFASPMHSLFIIEGSQPMNTRTAYLATGAVRAFLAPRIAKDAKIDLAPVLADIDPRRWAKDKARIISSLTKAATGKLAADANLEGLGTALGSLDPAAKEEAAEMAARDRRRGRDDMSEHREHIEELLRDKVDPETLASVLEVLTDPDVEDDSEEGMDRRTRDEMMDEVGGEDRRGRDRRRGRDEPPYNGATPQSHARLNIDRRGMDAAIAKATRDAEDRTIARLRGIADAERAVRPIVGDAAFETARDAAEVYKFALDHMGVDLTDVPAIAYKALFDTTAKVRAEAEANRPRFARDNAHRGGGAEQSTVASLAERFPGFHTRTA